MSKPSDSPSNLVLVNSQRLRNLAKRASDTEEQPASAGFPFVSNPQEKEDPANAELRQQIRQALAEILASLPAGKQRSLFKIRYGITLEALEQLPPQQAAATLKLETLKPVKNRRK